MKIILKLRIVVLIVATIIFVIGCTNEFDYGKLQNAVKTFGYSNVTQTTANVAGTVITDNGASLTSKGICYGTNQNPTIAGLKKQYFYASIGEYVCEIDNLTPGTVYYAKAYATNSYGTAYGELVSFKTLAATVPIISVTTTASGITFNAATTGGTITNSGASPVTSRGVCYSSTATIPTISGTKTNNGTGIGNFVSTLTSLSPNTIYYIRAYAINGIGVAYGDVKSFKTSIALLPSLTTNSISNITQTTAISGGNITSDGGANITSRGVCWSNTTSTPTTANSKTIDGTGIGSFSSSIYGLMPGTTYYVRAYAINSTGIAYGSARSFVSTYTTIPTGITTANISIITQNSANSGGNVTSDGGSAISSRGVCWSTTSSSPTISNPKTVNGTGIGSFVSPLTGLYPNTTYYVRAYATNSTGTAYGNSKSFTTSSGTIPTGVVTNNISTITQNTAVCGGNIGSDGGNGITSKGVCWSNTTATPTTSNSKTNNGTGVASFISSLSGLVPNTTYYIRAYATNGYGTAYGATKSFTTLTNLSIGQSYQGGIIAYIYAPGDSGYIAGQTHGLIATTNNQSSGSQWGCSGTSIPGTSTAIGSGVTNTTSIVNGCTSSNIAAALCNNLVSAGYSDWYLPSRDELSKLYINRVAIGGFSNTSYWSSSQASATTAWSVNFSTGTVSSTSTKSTLMYVRAIRKF